MLLPDDFKANTKIKVNNHLFNKENLPGHFKFKEYCPQVFRNLRERFGIEDLDYQVSLTRSPPFSVDDQGEGLLLNSYDRTLVVKQISSEDVADMHNILSEYHQHIVKCHGNTLLPQFLGMYRVTVDSEETYLMVMRNMFSHRLVVHRKYDLKGSLVDREASDKERPGKITQIVLCLLISGAPQREVYFMGLIDVLTQYDTKKKAAHAAKTVKHGAGAEISTVHPEQYAKRFRDFISNIFA
ncbi:phosphatidylinositol 5-phosphate 4-kinase type-2 gamma [Neolamprologus brichardi]|uniref:phosphatidylinositol 5-phosphate 4-kinase type-2 gamma n=1 Tax=Neolamprologus brichardi TaxID=32507 RepID=UPI001643C87B|nr:phosphatidylinositol 5-phosphate 4-kinase type-2 gamma [Neolamprologus brichardi]